ncbi:hypothetical protein ASD42_10330 [Nocardia sp. Root136]|uniref:hypothetical protein n=1 Tax=Nocardia sp. Root136 TaxID=1736458 RepID=UPI0006FA4EAE|nr:hypothetical protein [Nocardia sp. Root136]KQY39650.1 hypothetical protein ASD42_10330 [Nocardia sp. Root136]
MTETAPDKTLRATTAIFAVALLVHGADHLRRGMDATSALVNALGTLQLLFALFTVFLVFRGHSAAPRAAVFIGFASAFGFTIVHVLPDWFGPLSDSFVNAPPSSSVTGFSWFAALFEIAADLAIALVGLRVLRSRRVSVAWNRTMPPTALGSEGCH